MLRKFLIRNFQSHRRLSLDLDPRITTLIGPSDIGKSAVLRALRWALMNVPAGQAFVHDGTSTTSVTIIFDEGSIKRSVSKGSHVYQVNDSEYRAFGRNVPEAVQSVARVSSLNFLGQHDSPLWFSESAGQVAQQLNEIVDLSLIDRTASNLARALREARTVLAERERNQQEARESLRTYDQVPQIREDYGRLMGLFRENAEKGSKVCSLTSVVSGVSEAIERLDRVREVCLRGNSTVEKGEKAVETGKSVRRLAKLVKNVVRLRKSLQRPIPDMKALEMRKVNYLTADEVAQRLSNFIELTSVSANQAAEGARRFNQEMDRIAKITKGRCPLCNQKVNHSQLR